MIYEPWVGEPDREEWVDEITGLRCLILRHSSMRHLCGYVAVPEAHSLHGKGCSDEVDLPESFKDRTYDKDRTPVIAMFCAGDALKRGKVNIELALDVHGGVTFAGELRGEEGYWFGFDCAHSGDLSPGLSIEVGHMRGDIYRDIGYVRREVTGLAKQLGSWPA